MAAAQHDTRVEELQQALLDTREPAERAHIHLELGKLAARHGRVELAVRHFREALLYDRRLEQARQLLRDLDEGTQIHSEGGSRRRGAMRALLGRFRKR